MLFLMHTPLTSHYKILIVVVLWTAGHPSHPKKVQNRLFIVVFKGYPMLSFNVKITFYFVSFGSFLSSSSCKSKQMRWCYNHSYHQRKHCDVAIDCVLCAQSWVLNKQIYRQVLSSIWLKLLSTTEHYMKRNHLNAHCLITEF